MEEAIVTERVYIEAVGTSGVVAAVWDCAVGVATLLGHHGCCLRAKGLKSWPRGELVPPRWSDGL